MEHKNTRLIKSSATLNAWMTNLANVGRGQKQMISMFADASIAILALWLAYSLRHGMPFSDFRHTWYLFIIMPALVCIIYAGLGIYHWVVRSTNRHLFSQLGKASVLCGFTLLVVMYLLPPDRSNPRSLFLLFAGLLLLGSITMRVAWQSLFDTNQDGAPVAIYGAGSAGRQIAALLSGDSTYSPVMFIDDNPSLEGTYIQGLRVVSSDSNGLAEKLLNKEVATVILAMPSIATSTYQQLVGRMQDLGLSVHTTPSISEIIAGRISKEQIREVSISDILGRSEVDADPEIMGREVTEKVVLVTGGGGSIGSELCRQIARLSPKKLIVVDHSEENLYHINEELQPIFASGASGISADDAYEPVLCTVNEADAVKRVFEQNTINTVFHAAAYKHVPIIERQPSQGVKTNVFGTLNVLDTAIAAGVENFVLISTDKAVRPTNAMGASKRVAELCLQARAKSQSTTKISMVRFGNVLGSSGSVVPKFKAQIKGGGPVTITHKNITRYFMTIPEAAQLVLQASAIARGGDVFVLDMGEPVKIADLAKTMVRLSGARLAEETGDSKDIEIRYEGLRPGEKMYEELFIGNAHRPTSVKKIFTADEVMLPWQQLQTELRKLQHHLEKGDEQSVRTKVLELALYSGSGSDTIPKRKDSEDDPLNPQAMTV